jgi:hypothetical protein
MAPDLDRLITSPEEADEINEAMVQAMERRRQAQPERRQAGTTNTPRIERRAICGYCFQPGDHPTPAFCLRALER